MYSLDIHSGHHNMADTSQVGKCRLYTSFNTEKGNHNNNAPPPKKKKRHYSFIATTKIAYNTRAIMVLLWLLTITIHNLNFFFSLDTFSFKYFLFLRCCDKAVLMTKLSPHRNKPRLRCSYQKQKPRIRPDSFRSM